MKKFLNTIVLALVLMSCTSNEVRRCEKVVRRHATNNAPQIIYYYDVVGKDSTWVEEKWFHDNGVLNLEGKIVNGKREGQFKGYYPSGNLMSEGCFINGVREGRSMIYHENGVVSISGEYKNGKQYGTWKFFNESGETIDIRDYQQDADNR